MFDSKHVTLRIGCSHCKSTYNVKDRTKEELRKLTHCDYCGERLTREWSKKNANAA